MLFRLIEECQAVQSVTGVPEVLFRLIEECQAVQSVTGVQEVLFRLIEECQAVQSVTGVPEVLLRLIEECQAVQSVTGVPEVLFRDRLYMLCDINNNDITLYCFQALQENTIYTLCLLCSSCTTPSCYLGQIKDRVGRFMRLRLVLARSI